MENILTHHKNLTSDTEEETSESDKSFSDIDQNTNKEALNPHGTDSSQVSSNIEITSSKEPEIALASNLQTSFLQLSSKFEKDPIITEQETSKSENLNLASTSEHTTSCLESHTLKALQPHQEIKKKIEDYESENLLQSKNGLKHRTDRDGLADVINPNQKTFVSSVSSNTNNSTLTDISSSSRKLPEKYYELKSIDSNEFGERYDLDFNNIAKVSELEQFSTTSTDSTVKTDIRTGVKEGILSDVRENNNKLDKSVFSNFNDTIIKCSSDTSFLKALSLESPFTDRSYSRQLSEVYSADISDSRSGISELSYDKCYRSVLPEGYSADISSGNRSRLSTPSKSSLSEGPLSDNVSHSNESKLYEVPITVHSSARKSLSESLNNFNGSTFSEGPLSDTELLKSSTHESSIPEKYFMVSSQEEDFRHKNVLQKKRTGHVSFSLIPKDYHLFYRQAQDSDKGNGADSFFLLSACELKPSVVPTTTLEPVIENQSDSSDEFYPLSAYETSGPLMPFREQSRISDNSNRFYPLSHSDATSEPEMPSQDRTSFLSNTWDSHLKHPKQSPSVRSDPVSNPLPQIPFDRESSLPTGYEPGKLKQKTTGKKKDKICKEVAKPQRREPMGSENTDTIVSTGTVSVGTASSVADHSSELAESEAENFQAEPDFFVRPPLVGQSDDPAIKISQQQLSDSVSLRGPSDNEINLSDSLFSSSTSIESRDSLSHRVEALLGEKVKLPKIKISTDLSNLERPLKTNLSRNEVHKISTDQLGSQDMQPFIDNFSKQEMPTANQDEQDSDQEATVSISEGLISVDSVTTVIPMSETKSRIEEVTESRQSPLSLEINIEHSSSTSKFEQPLETIPKSDDTASESLPSSRVTPLPPGASQQNLFLYGSRLLNMQEQRGLLKPEEKYLCKRPLSSDSNEADLDESGRSGYPSDYRASPISVSSLSSNKKLEWDNGADIGYGAVISALSNLKGITPADFAMFFRSEPEGVSVFCKDAAAGGKKTDSNSSKGSAQDGSSLSKIKTSSLSEHASGGESVSSANSSVIHEGICGDKSQRMQSVLHDISENEKILRRVHQLLQSQIATGFRKSEHAHIAIQTDPLPSSRDVEVQSRMPYRNTESPVSSLASLSSGSTVRIATEMVYERKKKEQGRKIAPSTSPLSEPADLGSFSHRVSEAELLPSNPLASFDIFAQTHSLNHKRKSSSLPFVDLNSSQDIPLQNTEIPFNHNNDVCEKSISAENIKKASEDIHYTLNTNQSAGLSSAEHSSSDISLPFYSSKTQETSTARNSSPEETDISCHEHLNSPPCREGVESTSHSDNHSNSEQSGSDNTENGNIDIAPLNFINDMPQVRFQFPYPQELLQANLSSLLLLDENLSNQECEIFNANADNIVVIGSPGVERLISEEQPEGPKIRWYPMTGRPSTQDIRHAATQTCVSFIAENLTDGDSDYPDEEPNRNLTDRIETALFENISLSPQTFNYDSANYGCQTEDLNYISAPENYNRNEETKYAKTYDDDSCLSDNGVFSYNGHYAVSKTASKVDQEVRYKFVGSQEKELDLLTVNKASNGEYEIEKLKTRSKPQTLPKMEEYQESQPQYKTKVFSEHAVPSFTLPNINSPSSENTVSYMSQNNSTNHRNCQPQGLPTANSAVVTSGHTLPSLSSTDTQTAAVANIGTSQNFKNITAQKQLHSNFSSTLSVIVDDYNIHSKVSGFPKVEKGVQIKSVPRYAPAGQVSDASSQPSIKPTISVTHNISAITCTKVGSNADKPFINQRASKLSLKAGKVRSCSIQANGSEHSTDGETASKSVSSEEVVESRLHPRTRHREKLHKCRSHRIPTESTFQRHRVRKTQFSSDTDGFSEAECLVSVASTSGHQDKFCVFVGNSTTTPRPKTLGQGHFSSSTSLPITRLTDNAESSCRESSESVHFELSSTADSKYSSKIKDFSKEMSIHYERHVPVGSVMESAPEPLSSQTEAPLQSLTHSETMESTHTGSDDAQSPSFPPEVLGSCTDPSVPSPGIYGTRKFTEKYPTSSVNNTENGQASHALRLQLIENKQNESTSHLISSDIQKNNHDSYTETVTEKDVSFSHSKSKNRIIMKNSDDGLTKKHLSNSNTLRTFNETLPHGSGIDKNSSSVHNHPRTNYLHNPEASSHAVLSQLSSKTAQQTVKQTVNCETEDSTSQAPSNSSKSSVPHVQRSRSISGSKTKLSRAAHRELEKLKNLVERQKRNYLKRLQMEVERLERLEDIVLYQTLKLQTSISSNTSITASSSIEQTEPKSLYYSSLGSTHVKQISSSIQSDSKTSATEESASTPLSAGNQAQINVFSVPKSSRKNGVHKAKSVEHGSHEATNSHDMPISRTYNLTLKKDFCQNFPTPLPSEEEYKLKAKMESVGIQTTDSLQEINLQTNNKDRYFVSLLSSTKIKKDKRGHVTNKDKNINSRRKTSKHSKSRHESGVAWFIPASSHRRSTRSGYRRGQESFQLYQRSHNFRNLVNEKNMQSLQEAFLQNCGHLIRRSQARLIKISKLAEVRRKCTALAIERAKLNGHSRNRILELKNDVADKETKKTFTHKEMRDQTEKIYKNLGEVVEKKDRRKREEQYKTNRLMAQIYNKKLQEQALKGKVSWAITQTCLTT